MNQIPQRWAPKSPIANFYIGAMVYFGAAIYLIFAIGSLEVNWVRLSEGIGRAAALFSGFLHPDFTSRLNEIGGGLIESLTITITSTMAGIALALPLAVGAARNITPMPFYVVCRGFITVSRSLHELVVALLFVVLFGFGPFAGFLTLVFATIGFLAKLLAEDIEDIDARQLEALRSTGAGFLSVAYIGILPQIMPRIIGLSMYRFDINFRDSAIIGIVGAGGIGATLNTSIERFEYGSAAAVLLIIISIVLLCEHLSGYVRARLK